MSHETLIPVKPDIAAHALVDAASTANGLAARPANPTGSGASRCGRIAWMKQPTRIKDGELHRRRAHPLVRGRHAERLGQLPRPPSGDARRSDGDHLGGRRPERQQDTSPIASCTSKVCRLANALKSLGVKKGDRVTIYLPMVLEAAVAMLACARIGAVHSVVFGGFSPDSLANRIQDCRVGAADHRRRRPPRRAQGGAEGQRRRRAEALPGRASTSSWSRSPARGADARRAATTTTTALMRQGLARLPAGGDGRRGPAVHPLHLGQHRQAEGRAAHHRRLHGVGELHA